MDRRPHRDEVRAGGVPIFYKAGASRGLAAAGVALVDLLAEQSAEDGADQRSGRPIAAGSLDRARQGAPASGADDQAESRSVVTFAQ